MVRRLGITASETIDPLLMRWGLKKRDLSDKAIDVFRALEAERAEMAERLQIAESMAVRDPLTAALNRRGFLQELHRTMSEVERYKTPAAVIYIDLDGFKALNDGYGHATGDAVLKHVGRVLLDSVRESDIVGRLGGDEFGIILNRASAEEAKAKAETLTQNINACAILHAGVHHHVRASLGVHSIAIAEDPEFAIARADEAMYADKFAKRGEERFGGF